MSAAATRTLNLGARTVVATCLALLAIAPAAGAASAGWSPAASMGAARRAHTATLLRNGKVLVAGGMSATRTLSSVELYDPARDAWAPTGRMSVARRNHTATLLANGSVLVAGGLAGGPALASAERYDPATGRWSAVPAMATAREQHAATLLANGKVLVTGGFDGVRPLASAELYDPVARSWSPAARLATARGAHTATRLADGSVLVAGGLTEAGATASTERYEPSARARAPAAPMIVARESHAATLLPGGELAVTGGDTTAGPTATAELFEPRSGAWAATPSMANARAGHAATLLRTGRLLVTGGFAGEGATASAEVYDPGSGAWSPAPSMATARDQHTATELPDGEILLGGGSAGTASVAIAERYTPKDATAISAHAPGPVVIGATVLATAVVSGQARPAAGEVIFEAFKPADATCSNVPGFISTVRIAADGSATSRPFRPTAPGTWRWVASWDGDRDSNDAVSACDDPAAALVVRLAAPAIAATGVALGAGRLADAASVGPRVDPQPSATIDFRLYGPGDATCSTAPVFESRVPYPPAGGTVTSGAFTPTVPGTYRWRASYSGDASNAAAAAACHGPTTVSWSLQRWRPPQTRALAGDRRARY